MRIWISIGMLMATTVGAYASARLPLCQKSTPFRAWLRWALSVQSLRLSGNAADANKGGLTMRIWISVGILIASTVGAYAQIRLCLKSTPFRVWLRWVSWVQSRCSSGNAAGPKNNRV